MASLFSPALNTKALENCLRQLKVLFETDPVKAVVLAIPIRHLLHLFYDGTALEESRAKEVEA